MSGIEHDYMEDELSKAIEEDAETHAMAMKLAPRPYEGTAQRAQREAAEQFTAAGHAGQKRSMVPVEHFSESIMTLQKALEDLKSLRTRLIGEPGPTGRTDTPQEVEGAKLPVVGQLHHQASNVARLANEMGAVIAQIREKL